MKKVLSIIILFLASVCCLFAVSACNEEELPYYGTYKATSTFAGSDITINSDGFKYSRPTAQKYTFDESNNRISVEDFALKFTLFRDYTVLASLPVLWNTFEFQDYNNGSISLRCIDYGNKFDIKTVITASTDGSYTYIDYDNSIMTSGEYLYKDGFLKLDKDLAFGATYISGNIMYTAVWIKNYETFWNSYSIPDSPTVPDTPTVPDNPTVPNKPTEPDTPFVPDTPHEHNYTIKFISATCTEQGYTLYVCDCGDSLKTNYINANGHDYQYHQERKATCTEKGWHEYVDCYWCDYTTYEEIPELGHSIQYHDAQAPTCTEKGWKAYEICSQCDYSTYEEIAPHGHTFINGYCKDCDEPEPTLDVLLFWLNKSGTYEVEVLDKTTQKIVIPSVYNGKPVTALISKAFSGCSKLTSITIPDSVMTIGSSAFSGCSELTSITIPDSVTTIGSSAFSSCNKLTNITIPDSVISFDSYGAFIYCRSLTSVTIPDSVTSIGNSAFA